MYGMWHKNADRLQLYPKHTNFVVFSGYMDRTTFFKINALINKLHEFTSSL